MSHKKYFLKKELATRFRVSISTIERWVADNIIPPPIRLGPNRIVWEIQEIVKWELDRKEKTLNVKKPKRKSSISC